MRRHSAGERVELASGTPTMPRRLMVAGPRTGAPVVVGGGGGYGLTGMRERAELLGGRLDAAPTTDGFSVRLWLPAETQPGEAESHADRARSEPSEASP